MMNHFSLEMLMKHRQTEIEKTARSTWQYSKMPTIKRVENRKPLFQVHAKKPMATECCCC